MRADCCPTCGVKPDYPHAADCATRRNEHAAGVAITAFARASNEHIADIQRQGDAIVARGERPAEEEFSWHNDLGGMTSSEALNLLGQAPSHLPAGAAERKAVPIATGVIDYFPDALVAIAVLSRIGNDQHNPGKPLHWDRSKSGDEADTLLRHFLDRGTYDTDGVRHSTKVAWRALALLQKEIEADRRALYMQDSPA